MSFFLSDEVGKDLTRQAVRQWQESLVLLSESSLIHPMTDVEFHPQIGGIPLPGEAYRTCSALVVARSEFLADLVRIEKMTSSSPLARVHIPLEIPESSTMEDFAAFMRCLITGTIDWETMSRERLEKMAEMAGRFDCTVVGNLVEKILPRWENVSKRLGRKERGESEKSGSRAESVRHFEELVLEGRAVGEGGVGSGSVDMSLGGLFEGEPMEIPKFSTVDPAPHHDACLGSFEGPEKTDAVAPPVPKEEKEDPVSTEQSLQRDMEKRFSHLVSFFAGISKLRRKEFLDFVNKDALSLEESDIAKDVHEDTFGPVKGIGAGHLMTLSERSVDDNDVDDHPLGLLDLFEEPEEIYHANPVCHVRTCRQLLGMDRDQFLLLIEMDSLPQISEENLFVFLLDFVPFAFGPEEPFRPFFLRVRLPMMLPNVIFNTVEPTGHATEDDLLEAMLWLHGGGQDSERVPEDPVEKELHAKKFRSRS
eukprot:TRINITY_DN937_c1_g4_i1.p1 TRINITY_DN937_c1_g4~~TRINITY_DN937_c1_g4_i1.p1  ORF type:complete len:479 (-),score=126.26 TRINITY_DN937_c1_g4_i1:1963-3399(-)